MSSYFLPFSAVIRRGTESWNQERVNQLGLDPEILPDIRGTAPTHLQIQNEKQREMLRFTNAIANTGPGHWQVRRGDKITDQAQVDYAIALGLSPDEVAVTSQELRDEDGSIRYIVEDAGLTEYHPEHKHFHIGETAQFSVQRYDGSGGLHDKENWDEITGLDVVKTTFCLIDIDQIAKAPGDDPNLYETIKSPTKQRAYWDCFSEVQGISPGWIDRYSHSLKGQEIDITGLDEGTYRIVVEVNPSRWYIEGDYANNVAWTAFELRRDSNGNPKVDLMPEGRGGIYFDQLSNGLG